MSKTNLAKSSMTCCGSVGTRGAHGRSALRLALVYARRGELAEGQRWADRAVTLGPKEVAQRAARLRDALREELSA